MSGSETMDQQHQGIMTFFEADAHSFVMRIWRENRDDPDSSAEWRGWIEHVQSTQRHYFRSVSEIPQIVSAYVADMEVLDEQVFMPMHAKGDNE
jgi:hypothetical protein